MEILFFSASWCGMCKVIKPQFIEKCKQLHFTNYKFVDAEEDEDVANAYKVRNLPTAIITAPNADTVKLTGFDIINKLEQYVTI